MQYSNGAAMALARRRQIEVYSKTFEVLSN